MFARDTQFILSQKELTGVVNLDRKHAFKVKKESQTK
jgi:hypothetical protein